MENGEDKKDWPTDDEGLPGAGVDSRLAFIQRLPLFTNRLSLCQHFYSSFIFVPLLYCAISTIPFQVIEQYSSEQTGQAPPQPPCPSLFVKIQKKL